MKNPASDAEADQPVVPEAGAYINEMARKRGYVLDYHRSMARYDYDVLMAANNLVDAAHLKPRTLDRPAKELLFVLSLTVLRAEKSHIS